MPGHKYKKPSAAFHLADNGTIVYHDFHYAKYNTAEFLTLGEVYALITEQKKQNMSRVEIARCLAKLAIRIDYETKDSVALKKRLVCLHRKLEGIGVLKTTGEYK